MKKVKYPKLLAILAAILIASFIHGTPSSQASEPIKIGCVYPITGPLSFLGTYTRDGALVAVDEINKAGGILGRKVEWVHRDTELKPARAVTSFKELVLKEKCPLIIGFGTSSEGFAAEPLVRESKVPTINPDSMDKALNFNDNPYFYRLTITTTPMAEAMVDFVKRAGYKRIAISYFNFLFGFGARDDTVARMKVLGMEPVLTASHEMAEADYSPHALKIIGAKPDCVLSWTYGPPQPAMRRALADLGWKGPFIGYSPPAVTTDYRKLLPSLDLIDGTIYVMGYGKFGWPHNRPGMAQLEIRLDERFGAMYEHIDVPMPIADYRKGYMAMLIAKFYIEKAGTTDPEKINKALETYSFKGPLYDCNFKPGYHELSTDPKDCYIGTFKEGREILHELEPKNLPLFEELRWQAQGETYKRATYKRGVTIREFYRRWQTLLKKNESKVRAQISERKSTVKDFTSDVAKLYEDTLDELLTTKF